MAVSDDLYIDTEFTACKFTPANILHGWLGVLETLHKLGVRAI